MTNDTGPMHLAVGVGTPVIDLSVGHVDFRETGPYGPGHWMVQPDLGCAPCGFDQVCFHHACKDRLVPEQIGALCLHVLTGAPFPFSISSARIYRSCADEDGLGSTELQAGREDPLVDWYGRFWRRFWFEEFTGRSSQVPCVHEPAPDWAEAQAVLEHLVPLAKKLVSNAEELVRLTTKRPLPVSALQQMQRHETEERQQIVSLSMQSPATASLAVAMVRDTHNDDGHELTGLAQSRLATYRRWHKRLQVVSTSFRSFNLAQGSVRRGRSRPLPMMRSA
ncbi:MAG: glycosyltransferase family 9 protein [Nitrospira sp.]